MVKETIKGMKRGNQFVTTFLFPRSRDPFLSREKFLGTRGDELMTAHCSLGLVTRNEKTIANFSLKIVRNCFLFSYYSENVSRKRSLRRIILSSPTASVLYNYSIM